MPLAEGLVLELLRNKLDLVGFLTLTGNSTALAKKDCFRAGAIFLFGRGEGAVTKFGLKGDRKDSGFKNIFTGLAEIVNRNVLFKNLICYKIVTVKTVEAEKKEGFNFGRGSFTLTLINMLSL